MKTPSRLTLTLFACFAVVFLVILLVRQHHSRGTAPPRREQAPRVQTHSPAPAPQQAAEATPRPPAPIRPLLDAEQASIARQSVPVERAASPAMRAASLGTEQCRTVFNATAPSENDTSVEVVADGVTVEHPLTGKLHDRWTIVVPTECGGKLQSVSVRFLPSRVTLMLMRGTVVVEDEPFTRRRAVRP